MTETRESERNTGYKFELLDQEAYDNNELLAQMGSYDSRHEAVGMAAVLGRRYDYDYEVRWYESLWREVDDPTECDWCGHEEYYRPLVAWTFASGFGPDEEDGGAFCSDECYRRWAWKHYPDALRDDQ